jgi:hypothetical protein
VTYFSLIENSQGWKGSCQSRRSDVGSSRAGEAEMWQRKEAGPAQSEGVCQPQVWGTLACAGPEDFGRAGFMCAFE